MKAVEASVTWPLTVWTAARATDDGTNPATIAVKARVADSATFMRSCMSTKRNARRMLAVKIGIGLLALLTGACAGPATTPSTSPTASLAAAPNGSATASPKPTRTPIPPLAEGMTRFKGTITDASTGYSLEDVCVIIGPPVDCQENFPHSDAKGFWLADLPVAAGLTWTFNFSKVGYALTIRQGTSSAPGEQIIDVQLPKK